ncbi:hypothetical protein GGX14DRAFT_479910 [Mycena pura]|uniref:Transmembrane protein n=1 Tax=Mycena pura TaxID=153505 RepID=A0AAD6UTP2_9AGAR|nr:hypothetical protein GGX14DRAFT_479910 [Mycena pura]
MYSPPALRSQSQSDQDLYSQGDTSDPKLEVSSPTIFNRREDRRRFEFRTFLSSLFGWPLIVIGGHTVLQVFAWTFFATVERRKFIVLPSPAATYMDYNAHLGTLISTAISTVLAAASSYLFSLGLRRSLVLNLNRPMTLGTFFSTVAISSRSLVLNPWKRKWTPMSIVFVLLTGVQTTGWTTLLTPVAITIQTPLIGTEINLSSNLLAQMQSSGALDGCIFNTSILPAFAAGQVEAGYAAAKHSLDFPASFTLMSQNFDVSTAGILPMTLSDVNATSWFSGVSVIPGTLRFQPNYDPPSGLNERYSMVQQGPHSVIAIFYFRLFNPQKGFTANVSCTFQDVLTDTNPAVVLQTVQSWTNNLAPDALVFTQMNYAQCAVPQKSPISSTYAYTDSKRNYVLLVGCVDGGNYTLVLTSGGAYNFLKTTVCTFTPKITRVQVVYTDANLYAGTIQTDTSDTGAVADEGGLAGLSAVITIADMVFFSQATQTNTFGDEIKSLIANVNDDAAFVEDDILRSVEQYITGVAEYSGSVFRACLSGKNGVFPGGVPANMTTTSNGLYLSDTFGWTKQSAAAGWALLPGFVVALVTITVVVTAVAKHASDGEHPPFDPSNSRHLVAAAVAGGLHETFTSTEEEDIRRAESYSVVLGYIPGRGPALIRTSVTESA